MRRVRLTVKQYNELVEARDWCAINALGGMKLFYDQLLEDHAYRRTLPKGIGQEIQQEDEREQRQQRSR